MGKLVPMRILAVFLGVLSLAIGSFAEDRSKEEVAYYMGWIGCPKPVLNCDIAYRTNYLEATYKGKSVLLYSFDAGNFANGPDLPRLTAELQSLHRYRTNSTNPFLVIGFTRGFLWAASSGEVQTPKEIEEVSRFPIVNLNNKWDHSLGEPFELLLEPGGILIDTNGIICAIFLHRMTEQDFKSIHSIPAWNEKVHDPPQRSIAKKKLQTSPPAKSGNE